MTGPDLYAPGCSKAADGMRRTGGFGEPEEWRHGWDRTYTRDEWLDVVPTFGGVGRLPSAVLRELLAGLGAAVDALGGSFTMQYTALVLTAARSDAA